MDIYKTLENAEFSDNIDYINDDVSTDIISRNFDTNSCDNIDSSTLLISIPFIDKDFGYKLFRLQVKAMKNQYLLACLSTLGGAYHLCNHPKTALSLAKRQECLGRQLDSKQVIFKALVFQAVNYDILGKRNRSKAMFLKGEEYVKKRATADESESMMRFLNASKLWLISRKISESQGSCQTMSEFNSFSTE